VPATLSRRDSRPWFGRESDAPEALSLSRNGATVPEMNAADSLLMARLAAGDDSALAEAFDLLGPVVYGAALRVLGQRSAAQDVVQDVFVELWRRPDRYDPELGSLRSFLFMKARHRAMDVGRSELRRNARHERHHRLTPAQRQPSPCEQVTDADAAREVRAAIRLLPVDQRQVVELAYYEDMTCREVAVAAGIPECTAKSRLRLALAKLAMMLDRELLESS
jgi:RNA polymerase sigma-70 factor (ECF subfamily)